MEPAGDVHRLAVLDRRLECIRGELSLVGDHVLQQGLECHQSSGPGVAEDREKLLVPHPPVILRTADEAAHPIIHAATEPRHQLLVTL